jgi:glycosyltransferase involved in cell wall biosynthesis
LLITVGVTTHNRAQSLDRLMRSLCRINARPDDEVEFVVVANACTDETVELLRSYEGKLALRIVIENRLGVSHGRNAVVQHARGDIIVWTDDDVTVEPNWVANYAAFFDEHRQAAFAGGPIQPFFEGDRQPYWMDAAVRKVPSSYAKLDLGSDKAQFRVNRHEAPYGANMAMRTALLAADRFDTRLGRVGQDDLSGGEETKLFYEWMSSGLEGWWLPNQCVTHWVDEKRQTLPYLKNYWYQVGKDEASIQLQVVGEVATYSATVGHRVKQFRLWLRYIMARAISDPDTWILALRDHQLQRGRLTATRNNR